MAKTTWIVKQKRPAKFSTRAYNRCKLSGRRQYVGADEIPRVLGGMGISVISTPRGVMAGHQAKKQNLGGELLLTVY